MPFLGQSALTVLCLDEDATPLQSLAELQDEALLLIILHDFYEVRTAPQTLCILH